MLEDKKRKYPLGTKVAWITEQKEAVITKITGEAHYREKSKSLVGPWPMILVAACNKPVHIGSVFPIKEGE